MRKNVHTDDPKHSFEELDTFFDYPRAEPCNAKLDELLSSGSKNKGAVIKLYLENFKAFNETFGYQFGGQFLREIARFLCMAEGADVYRPAGVEFVIVLNNYKYSAAIELLEEIAERFENTWNINGLDCMCSVNLAIAMYPGYAGNSTEMLDQLNYAISVAAANGPNQYCEYDEALSMKLRRHNMIARMIPSAIEKGMVDLRYYPVYNTEAGRITRACSNIRLVIPEIGIINAAEFIPIAEESGQIYIISQYVVKKACELISKLLDKKIDFERIAVPISPIQFLQDRFVDDVKQAMSASGVPADRLAFEVSESVALSGFSSSHSRLLELSEMGIEIVFTEFGSGGSGISNILDVPVDTVKLERMLIWQMENIPNGDALVEGLIHIARNLSLKVIAMGVETKAQMELLSQYNCDYQEGLYISRALTSDELIEALERK